MRYYALVFGYLVCTTLAIVLFKQGAARSTLTLTSGSFGGHVDIRALIGVGVYVLSFTLWLLLLSSRPVAYIVPLTTALVHLSVLGAAVVFLHERVSWIQLTGVAFVIAGAVLISIKAPAP
jgi:drug/metabolite transporter (DMT)-like permease